MEAFMSAEFTSPLDQAKSEAFAEQMVGVLNSGALSLMLSIGHKTGLFDTMSHLAPSTSEQIARAAGVQGRDLGACLAAMWMCARVGLAACLGDPPLHATR